MKHYERELGAQFAGKAEQDTDLSTQGGRRIEPLVEEILDNIHSFWIYWLMEPNL